jgi:hypothetical protein
VAHSSAQQTQRRHAQRLLAQRNTLAAPLRARDAAHSAPRGLRSARGCE